MRVFSYGINLTEGASMTAFDCVVLVAVKDVSRFYVSTFYEVAVNQSRCTTPTSRWCFVLHRLSKRRQTGASHVDLRDPSSDNP